MNEEPFTYSGGGDVVVSDDKTVPPIIYKYILVPSLTSFATFSQMVLVLFVFFLFMLVYVYIISYDDVHFSKFTMFSYFLMDRPNNSQQLFKEYIEHLVDSSRDGFSGQTDNQPKRPQPPSSPSSPSPSPHKKKESFIDGIFKPFYVQGNTLKIKKNNFPTSDRWSLSIK
jgi:hypothetical protein